jgi:hypothetical protein
VYAAWDAHAANNAATLVLAVANGSLSDPVFHLRDYAAGAPPSRVTLDGAPLAADVDYFASVDTASSSLWITLGSALATGSHTLAVDP